MYYYFEIHRTPEEISDKDFIITDDNIHFFNELKNKPRTNSLGVWSSDHYHSKINTYKYVRQYWIDISKYKISGKSEIDFLVREIKFGELLNKCSCEDGIIVCPGCDGEESKYGICAGCNGSGVRNCGKCGGE